MLLDRNFGPSREMFDLNSSPKYHEEAIHEEAIDQDETIHEEQTYLEAAGNNIKHDLVLLA
jgi:hypothetical protein